MNKKRKRIFSIIARAFIILTLINLILAVWGSNLIYSTPAYANNNLASFTTNDIIKSYKKVKKEYIQTDFLYLQHFSSLKQKKESDSFVSRIIHSLKFLSFISSSQLQTDRATVRRGFNLNGRIEGSVQQLSGENTTFNSSAVLTGDLFVPGSPNLVRNGTSTFGGTVQGSGNAQPSNYSITLNGGSQLGRLMTRTDAVVMPTVAAPPAPTGTRNVTINNSSQSIGDFATLKNLTLNSNVGNKAIPPGTYGSFTANSGSGFILGTAGSSEPAVYNLTSLTLNNSQLQVVGPVILTLKNTLTLNGSMGSSDNPAWLEIRISSGGVTLNSGSVLYGSVVAPSGTATINSQLTGNVIADRLTVNSGGVLRIIQGESDTTPPVITIEQPTDGLVTSTSQITVSGTYSDESPTTITVNGLPVSIQDNTFSIDVPVNEGTNTFTLLAVDSSGNQSTATRSIIRDSVNPVLTVIQPNENIFLNTTTLTVLGTIEDQNATTVLVNGVAATITGNNFTAIIPVNEGVNNVVSVATDAAGNSTQLTRQITRDTIPPVLTIQQPANETVTSDSTILVTGTFSDANSVAISINGIIPTITGNTFSATVPLINGHSLVIVNATDAAGNETSKERKIVSATSLSLNLQQPEEQFVTNSKSVRVDGNVSGIDVVVTVNGVPFDAVGGYFFGGYVELNEGSNAVRVIATDVVGRTQETIRNVTVDTTAPVLSEITPAEGEMVDTTTTTIRGKVSDATITTVEVNDSLLEVDSNGYFTLNDFAVAEGDNNIYIAARDQVGNSQTINLTFQGKDRTAPANPIIFPFNQETVMPFITIEGRAEPGTILTINGGSEPTTAEAAFGSGLFFANVNLSDGINNLSISARDRAGNNSSVLLFNVTSDPTRNIPSQQPVKINIATNDTQKGLTGQPLPRPLIARVTDKQGKAVESVPVKFTVLYGDGQLIGGNSELTVATDAQGQANANFLAGIKTGIQLIRADFEGNLYKSVTFTAEILKSEPNTETSVSGLVLDQNLRALPNVLVRLGGQQTRTDNTGRFRMTTVQSGPHQILELIGREQITYPGRWTNISFDIDVLPGINNNLGKPLFLPKVNGGINLPLNSQGIVTQDTTYELPVVGGKPPVRVTARAGTRVSFPPDIVDKRFSVTRIDANRVPMALEDGRATNLYISVQPSGAVFEPALEVSFPNLDGLNPNEKSLLMSFDHDAGRYVQVGTAQVSADGRVVNSDPGSGIRVGAWHATPPEDPLPEATVLSFVQIEGNPTFEDKDVEVTEASILGVRAVPYNEETNAQGILTKILLRGVVSFPRNSPPQTAKVLAYADADKPTIEFDEGNFNYENKELFLAEDKEISLSWKVVGGDGSKYTITCEKPDKKKVIVTKCDDTTITVKGVIGEYDDAGETTFKVKAKGSKNGAKDATIKVNLVKVRYKENETNSGFDSLVKGKLQNGNDDPNDKINKIKDPWLTVVMKGNQTNPAPGGEQIAKYEVKPNEAAQFIEFKSDDITKAKVTSAPSDKKITVEGIASDGSASTNNETEINAKINSYKAVDFKVGKLNVVVRRRVKVNAAFFYIEDSSGTNTSMDPDDLDRQITQINEILLPQTGIEYIKFRVYHWDSKKEFGFAVPPATRLSVVNRDFKTVVSNAEWDIMILGDTNTPVQPKLCDPGADREIYFVWDTGMPDETIPNARVAAFDNDTPTKGTIISDSTSDMEAIAHEIAHSFQIRPSDLTYRYNFCDAQGNNCVLQREHSNVLRELMYATTGGRTHIPKADVDDAIKTISVSAWLSGGKPKRPC